MNKTCQSGEFSSWSLSSGVVGVVKVHSGEGAPIGECLGVELAKIHRGIGVPWGHARGGKKGQKQPKLVAQRQDMVSDTLALLIYKLVNVFIKVILSGSRAAAPVRSFVRLFIRSFILRGLSWGLGDFSCSSLA